MPLSLLVSVPRNKFGRIVGASSASLQPINDAPPRRRRLALELDDAVAGGLRRVGGAIARRVRLGADARPCGDARDQGAHDG